VADVITLPSEPVEIVAGRLQLRPVAESRLPGLLAAADAALRITSPLADPERAARFVAATNDWADGDLCWGVYAVDGDLLGGISVFHVSADQADGELGYWVLPAARRQGVAGDAVRAVARFCFAGVGLRRLQLFHAVDNPASCATATGAGFLLEGTLRQGYRYHDGLVRDEHLHARLATDPEPSG
jgi:RimJ/RimL family protein N-acetyltransferase